MDTNILDFIRDVLVIGYFFVLRIGVPLLIVFMWGAALKKWLDKPPVAVTSPAPVEKQEADDQGKLENPQSVLR
ncbi:MAG: hypothetical protein HY741_10745 [Chloroflexi bacterium]|nr:hypothetical protein [Chloroflexota bacterium]